MELSESESESESEPEPISAGIYYARYESVSEADSSDEDESQSVQISYVSQSESEHEHDNEHASSVSGEDENFINSSSSSSVIISSMPQLYYNSADDSASSNTSFPNSENRYYDLDSVNTSVSDSSLSVEEHDDYGEELDEEYNFANQVAMLQWPLPASNSSQFEQQNSSSPCPYQTRADSPHPILQDLSDASSENSQPFSAQFHQIREPSVDDSSSNYSEHSEVSLPSDRSSFRPNYDLRNLPRLYQPHTLRSIVNDVISISSDDVISISSTENESIHHSSSPRLYRRRNHRRNSYPPQEEIHRHIRLTNRTTSAAIHETIDLLQLERLQTQMMRMLFSSDNPSTSFSNDASRSPGSTTSLDLFIDDAHNADRGASRKTIESLKVSTISETMEELKNVNKECCICLDEFVAGNQVRHLPCSHVFHVSCVDKWLNLNATCPYCKFQIE